MADDEDPVEHEIDVYLSKNLAENLYLFQYPLRPAGLSYEDFEHLSSRVKPTQQKIELELGINTESSNYAGSKGEQIALNVDGINMGTESAYFRSDKMDKQVLTSSNSALQDVSRYAAGVLRNGELHLTPLHGIVQLRPSFSYLNYAENRQKTDNADESQGDEDAKPVMVRFTAPESAESRARKMASYEYLQRKNERESWINVQYHNSQDSVSQSLRSGLVAAQTNEVMQMQSTPADYLQKLIPRQDDSVGEKPALPSNILSIAQLKNMTLSDQIKALLTSAKLIRFNQLLALLPKETDVTSVLRSLQQVAVLVQGCWIVKSEVLYPKDSYSAHSGVPAEVLCRGRDYVMWRFTQSRFLVRKEITSIIKLPAEDVKDILEQMSRIKANKGWEFNLECDQEFISRNPDVVQRQTMLWEAKSQQLNKIFKINKDDKKAKGDVGSPPPDKPKRRRTTSTRSRTKSGDKSMSDQSDTDMDSPNRQGKGRRQRKHSEVDMDSPDRKEKGRRQRNPSEADMESPKREEKGRRPRKQSEVDMESPDRQETELQQRNASDAEMDSTNKPEKDRRQRKQNEPHNKSPKDGQERGRRRRKISEADVDTPVQQERDRHQVKPSDADIFSPDRGEEDRLQEKTSDVDMDSTTEVEKDVTQKSVVDGKMDSSTDKEKNKHQKKTSDMNSDSAAKAVKNTRTRRSTSHLEPEPMEVEDKQPSTTLTNKITKNGPSNSIKTNPVEKVPSLEIKTELLNFVQEKLYSRYVLNMTELKRLFSLKLAQSEPGHILATGVSEKLLEQTVLEVGGVKINSQWQPNFRSEPVYALGKTGDKFDVIRGTMLELFQKAPRLKSSNLKKRLEEETGEIPPETDLKKVLKDYCTTKGGTWYLKGTTSLSDS